MRLLLQKLGARWSHPVSQVILKLTEPLIKPLQKLIPGFKGFDLAIIVAAMIIQIVAIMLIFTIKIHIMPGFLGSMVIAAGYLGYKLVNIYIGGLILNAIISWIPTLQYSPLAHIVNTIAMPLLNLGRRYIPTVAGLDLSPIPLFLLLWLLKLAMLRPILIYGLHLAY